MNYATIKKTDVANGPGVRVSLFVSGCEHQCKGCFNQEAWDFEYGKEFTEETMKELLDSLSLSYIKGFTVLGGEPLHPNNVATVSEIISKVKDTFGPNKSIWLYTGYTWEQIMRYIDDVDGIDENGTSYSVSLVNILSNINVLVDGKFVEELKDLNLKFRGSSNQRLIDVAWSTKDNVICIDSPYGKSARCM